MSSSQDPLVVDQGASTEMPPVSVQTGLPRPRTCRSIAASYNLGVARCNATNWRETVRNCGWLQVGHVFIGVMFPSVC